MVDLDAGELRHRITVQEVSHTPDGEGGFTEIWLDLATYWVSITPMRAKQKFEYKSVNVDATHLVKIRGNVSIQEDQRIIFRGRIFDILTVENEKEMNITKWVTCKEHRN